MPVRQFEAVIAHSERIGGIDDDPFLQIAEVGERRLDRFPGQRKKNDLRLHYRQPRCQDRERHKICIFRRLRIADAEAYIMTGGAPFPTDRRANAASADYSDCRHEPSLSEGLPLVRDCTDCDDHRREQRRPSEPQSVRRR